VRPIKGNGDTCCTAEAPKEGVQAVFNNPKLKAFVRVNASLAVRMQAMF